MKTSAFASILVLIVASGFGAGAGDAGANPEEVFDQVIRTDNVPVGKTILTQDNYEWVVGNRGVKVAACLVKDIEYANRDANFNSAIKARDENRYMSGALYFLKALETLAQTKWAVEYCNYGIGDALYQAEHYSGYKGKSGTVYGPPAVYFRKALAANKKSRFLPDIVVKLPVCLAEESIKESKDGKLTLDEAKMGEADAALKEAEILLKQFEKDTTTIHVGFADMRKRAYAQLSIADVRIMERKAKFGKATWAEVKEKWYSARFKCTGYPELQALAQDGILRTLLAMGDYSGAKDEAERLINKYKQEGSASLLPQLSGAYIVQGEAFLAQAADMQRRGAVNEARKNYADARWAFLHVVGEFFDNEDHVVRAHYSTALCYEQLRGIEPEAAEKAAQHWNLVVNNFGKNDFQDRAKEGLKRLGAAGAAEPKATDPAKPAAPAKAAEGQPAKPPAKAPAKNQ